MECVCVCVCVCTLGCVVTMGCVSARAPCFAARTALMLHTSEPNLVGLEKVVFIVPTTILYLPFNPTGFVS